MGGLSGKLKRAIFTFISLGASHKSIFYRRFRSAFTTLHVAASLVGETIAQPALFVIEKVELSVRQHMNWPMRSPKKDVP
jgi:hypothetical protein